MSEKARWEIKKLKKRLDEDLVTGKFEEAKRIAEEFPKLIRKVENKELIELTSEYINEGELDIATNIAREISDVDVRARLLKRIGNEYLKIGNVGAAEKVADALCREDSRMDAVELLAKIAKWYINRGDYIPFGEIVIKRIREQLNAEEKSQKETWKVLTKHGY
jgi:hypothetical protein